MGHLSDYLVFRCLHVLDSLQNHHISTIFSRPIDPERDNCPTYFQIIRQPMDLGTVRKKLQSAQYQTVRQWKDDVELIWSNSYQFNGRQSLISVLARHLQQLFREMTDTLTDNPVSDWVTTLDLLSNEVDRLEKLAPEPASAPKSKAKSMITRQKIEFVEPRPKSPTVPKKLTESEINELADKVNEIEDPDQINLIIETIKKHEPHLAINGEELEIEVNKLQQSTRLALRSLTQEYSL
jgi:hypothetical protein